MKETKKGNFNYDFFSFGPVLLMIWQIFRTSLEAALKAVIKLAAAEGF